MFSLSLDPFDGAREVQGECRIKLACYAEPQPSLVLATSCLRVQSYGNKNGVSEFFRVLPSFCRFFSPKRTFREEISKNICIFAVN